MRDKRKKKMYHLYGRKRPPLVCQATAFLGGQLDWLALHAAAASLCLELGTDVPLGQSRCLSGTAEPRLHSHLVPGVDWEEGFTVESPQCMDSAGSHHPEKETRLKENEREPPTTVQ